MSSTQYIDEVGTVICRVELPTAGWFGESKENKTPFLRLPLVVTDPESSQNGRRIVKEFYITEKSADGLARTMKNVFGVDDIFELDGPEDEVPAGPAGQYCSIVTEAEFYKDKERIKVAWVNTLDYKPQMMATEKIGSLKSIFGSRMRAIAKATRGPEAQQTQAPDSRQSTEDEIPF